MKGSGIVLDAAALYVLTKVNYRRYGQSRANDRVVLVMDMKDLTGAGEVGTKFLDMCGAAVGGFFRPGQIRRVSKATAEAESEAAIIKARGEVEVEKIKAMGVAEVSEVEHRAMNRMVHEEGMKQENIEGIIAKALPEVREDAKPEDVDTDWTANFFDRARLISDEEMQHLWAKVLAGEANSPGSFSKRTVNFLQTLSKEEAEQFQTLCCFSIVGDGTWPIIFDTSDPIYLQNGITFEVIQNFQGLGLLTFDFSGFMRPLEEEDLKINYFAESWQIIFEIETLRTRGMHIPTGLITLTNMGKEVASLCQLRPIRKFMEYLATQWPDYGVQLVKLQNS